MSLPGLPWQWCPVSEVATPRAAVAWGVAARQLHQRLTQLDEAQRASLQATANRDVLIVLGEASELPWVDGVAYAAPSVAAPALWLPLHWQPDVPEDLLGRALERQYGRKPLLLWREPSTVVPLDRQLPLSARLLASIADHWLSH